MSRRNQDKQQMHAIIFCINATVQSQELNYQIQEHIAKLGILKDSQNSYNQMILVGTKAETLDDVDRENWVRDKAKPFFDKADRGEGKWCFTEPKGERDAMGRVKRDPTTGQYPDLDTEKLETILKEMPIKKIHFKEGFTDEFIRQMLETTGAIPKEKIDKFMSEIAKLRSQVADLKNRVRFSTTMQGKEGIETTRKDLKKFIKELRTKEARTKTEDEALAKHEQNLEFLTRVTDKKVRTADLLELIKLKMPAMVAPYRLLKANRQWQNYQYAEQTGDYDVAALTRIVNERKAKEEEGKEVLARALEDARTGRTGSCTGKKRGRGRPPKSPKTPPPPKKPRRAPKHS